jgi:hypothetical protein
MPGLRGYRINFVDDILPFGVERAIVEFDGTAELWFDGESMKQAFASDIAKEAVADTDRVCARRIEFETEEHVVIDGPAQNGKSTLKIVVLLRRRADMAVEEWRHWWLDHIQRSHHIPNLRGYRINLVDVVRGNGYEPNDVAYDGTAELWFDDIQAMEEGFGSGVGLPIVQDSAEHCTRRVRLLTEEHIII